MSLNGLVSHIVSKRSIGILTSLWEVCLGANTTCTIFGGKLNRVYSPTGWLRSSVRIGPVFAEASETGDFRRRLRIRAAEHSVSCDHPESLRQFSEK